MKAFLYGQTASGDWKPLAVDSQGSMNRTIPNGWSYVAASGGIVDTSDVTLVAAAGAGNVNYLKTLQYHNSDASVSTEVVVKTSSTILWRGYAPAAMTAPAQVSFDPPLASLTNTSLTAAAITTSAELYVNAQGYSDLSLTEAQAVASPGEEIFADDGTLLLSDTSEQLYLTPY